MLGYRVERSLHEDELDQYIDPLRQRFPLVANKMEASGRAPSEVAARSVVDGLALHRNFDAFVASEVEIRHRETFRLLKKDLNDALDAVSDLLTAESAFQIVRGNTAAAGATLDAVAKGTRPPDPEVARSPRSGAVITHRVALVLPPRSGTASVWGPSLETSVRAQLEPTLDAWVGRVLGDPGLVCCSVLWKRLPQGDTPGTDAELLEVTLRDLRLLPLDVLALSQEEPANWHLEAPPGSPPGTPLAGPADELNRRILAFVTANRDRATVIEIRHSVPDPATKRTFPQLWEVARTLNDALRSARSMCAEDLTLAGARSAISPSLPTDEVSGRIVRALDRLVGCCSGLLSTRSADVRSNLELAARFGVPGAHPAPAWLAEGTDEALRTKRDEVARELVRRLAKAAGAAAPTEFSSARVGELRSGISSPLPGRRALEVAEAIFGAAPLLLLPFVLGGPPRTSVGFDGEGDPPSWRLGAKPAEVRRWFHHAARVRPPLARWRKLSLYLSTIPVFSSGRSDASLPVLSRLADLRIAQFSPATYNRWVALPLAHETLPSGATQPVMPPTGTISLAAHLPEGVPSGPWAGLVIDDWVELIPNHREVTGIAFHHDDPGAEAAQTVLVAVPPVEGAPWSAEVLASILNETLDLAKMRAVDAERIADLGQLIPAIHLADNTGQATVSTNFSGSLVTEAPTEGDG